MRFLVILLAGLLVIAVLIACFLYYRLDSIKREIARIRREANMDSKERNESLEIMASLAAIQQTSLLNRFQLLIEPLSEKDASTLLVIKPLLANYANLFHECVLKPKNMKVIVKTVYSQTGESNFTDFERYLSRQDREVKRLWSKTDVVGFVTLVDALLHAEEKKYGTAEQKLENAS